jgi:hypothetical protein
VGRQRERFDRSKGDGELCVAIMQEIATVSKAPQPSMVTFRAICCIADVTLTSIGLQFARWDDFRRRRHVDKLFDIFLLFRRHEPWNYPQPRNDLALGVEIRSRTRQSHLRNSATNGMSMKSLWPSMAQIIGFGAS